MRTANPEWNQPWLWKAFALAIGVGLALVLLRPAGQGLAQQTNVIVNGGFEDGFTGEPGIVEGLGNGWSRFDNGGAFYGWYDDTWPLVVAEGEHAQLIEIKNAAEQSRYAGIYQTVDVTPGQAYKFSLKGLVRSDEGNSEDSGFGYIMEVGFDLAGGSDWQAVTKWTELPFEEQPRLGPAEGGAFKMGSFETTITTTGPKLTVFIRAVKKWVGEKEGNYDVDAVSLVRADGAPAPTAAPTPTTAPDAPLPETGQSDANPNNLSRLVASGVLVLVLAGGAFLSLNRRRA